MRRGRPHRGRLGALLILLSFAPAAASGQTVTTIRNNGSPANRVDLVVLGDGYMAAELGKFASDAEAAVNGFFGQQPFAEYANYFNVHRIDMASAESGADHPSLGIYRNTAFGAYYDCFGIARLICVDNTAVMNVVTSSVGAASRDLIVVIVNDSEYGGSGGSIAVASTNAAAVELVLHEMGHTFGLLADEYDYSPPACNNSVEPSEVNVTRQTVRSQIKWNVWIDPSTPVPTFGTTLGVPGSYEGAKYCASGLFRPTYDSKMRNLGRPFEQINDEQLIKRVYNFAGPIDSVSPTGTAVTLSGSQSQTFTVTTPQPAPYSLSILWQLNGATVGTSPSYSLLASALPAGTHTLQLIVQDGTTLVRNDPAQALRATRTWTITITTPCTYSVSPTSQAFAPAGGTNQVNVTTQSGCAWSAASLVDFATMITVGPVTGSGTAQYTVAPNSGWPRLGSLDVAGQLVSISQAGLFRGDFDGDSIRDVTVFRPSTGAWYIRRSTGGATPVSWGQQNDMPVAGDYDGDGITDIAVFRPSTGGWFIIRSSGGAIGLTWGGPGDVPVPGDYDGDGITDIAIFRPSESGWYIVRSSGGAVGLAWGGVDDTPVPADYDGDGQTDVAVFRPSESAWYIVRSSGGSTGLAWGTTGDLPVVGDYDGDGQADVAVFRPSESAWYIVKSTGGAIGFTWGTVGDQPVVGDYDGDGIDDVAVFRESDGGWYILLSGGGAVGFAWGTFGDVPI